MARSGDTARPHSVKAQFDDSFSATASGGAVLIEKAMRRLGLRNMFERHLPERQGEYSSADICQQVLAGLLCEGKGVQAAEALRRDPLLGRIFGYEKVAEEATVWRALCGMAGLARRSFSATYRPVASSQPALDLRGNEKKPASHERIVPDEPEAMSEERRRQFDQLTEQVAVRCAQSLSIADMRLAGYIPVHGDGTQAGGEGQLLRRGAQGPQRQQVPATDDHCRGADLRSPQAPAGGQRRGRGSGQHAKGLRANGRKDRPWPARPGAA